MLDILTVVIIFTANVFGDVVSPSHMLAICVFVLALCSQGLLGFAFSPSFSKTGIFYVSYVTSGEMVSGSSVVYVREPAAFGLL